MKHNDEYIVASRCESLTRQRYVAIVTYNVRMGNDAYLIFLSSRAPSASAKTQPCTMCTLIQYLKIICKFYFSQCKFILNFSISVHIIIIYYNIQL